jgi:hypothetical protein
MDRTSYGEAQLYQGVLIPCQSYHGNYVCPCGRAAMLHSDGMASSNQAPDVKCVWAPVAMSHHARH